MLTDEQKYIMELNQRHLSRIDSMPNSEILELISKDACPFDPTTLRGIVTEEFNCPLCGYGVYPGLPYKRRSPEPFTEAELTQLSMAGSDVDSLDL